MCNIFNCHSSLTFQAKIEHLVSFLKYGLKQDDTKDFDNLIILEADALFKKARMIWRQLEDIILCDRGPTNFKQIYSRNEIVKFLHQLLLSILDSKELMSTETKQKLCHFVKLLRKTVLPLHKLEDYSFNKLTPFALVKEESMVFHYFHTYLNSNWLLILIDFNLETNNEHIHHSLQLFIKDLIALSRKQYSKIDGITKESSEVNPFLCPCVKQAWLYVQLFTEKKLENKEMFWDLFNLAAADMEPSFMLWLVYHVSILHGINEEGIPIGENNHRVCPNHGIIEDKLKQLCNRHVSDQTLLNCLTSIEPLINNWWSSTAKISPYQVLWEHFNKALTTTKQESAANIPKGALKLIELKNNLRKNPSSAKNAFEFFVGMLVKHLTKHPMQWSKLKGRIYSKIPVQKTNILNDAGLYEIILLLVSIAFVDFGDVTSRIQNILENLPQERQNTELVWSFYIVLVSFSLSFALQNKN